MITLIGNRYIRGVLISSLLLLGGCAKDYDVKPKNIADNVQQHILSGLTSLENNSVEQAKRSFEMAERLNHNSSSVYSSLALVSTNKEEFLEKSEDFMDTQLDKYRYLMAKIRLTTNEEQLKGLYSELEDVKVKFLPYYHDNGSIDYFVGKQLFNIDNFKEANIYFEHLFQNYENSKFKNKARELFELSHQRLRANDLSKFSVTMNKIATKKEIKRADVAVILVDELHLDKLLNGFFKARKKDFDRETPRDILSHPNKKELSIINKYALRGLEPIIEDRELKFAPNRFMTRGDFALILEDIISKLKNDSQMKKRYFGMKSPFVDVKSSEFRFNAILNCVTMGFLKSNKYQEFRVNDTLTGAELIEAIAKIKEEIEL